MCFFLRDMFLRVLPWWLWVSHFCMYSRWARAEQEVTKMPAKKNPRKVPTRKNPSVVCGEDVMLQVVEIIFMSATFSKWLRFENPPVCSQLSVRRIIKDKYPLNFFTREIGDDLMAKLQILNMQSANYSLWALIQQNIPVGKWPRFSICWRNQRPRLGGV